MYFPFYAFLLQHLHVIDWSSSRFLILVVLHTGKLNHFSDTVWLWASLSVMYGQSLMKWSWTVYELFMNMKCDSYWNSRFINCSLTKVDHGPSLLSVFVWLLQLMFFRFSWLISPFSLLLGHVLPYSLWILLHIVSDAS